MINQEKKIVITFSMQDDLMAMNRFCKKNNIDGKVIHIPQTLTAGYGLSYELDMKYKNTIEKTLKDNGLFYEGIYEIII